MNAVGYLVGAGSMTLGVEAAGVEVQAIWETPAYSKNAKHWDLNRPRQRHQVLALNPNSLFFERYRGIDLVYGNPPCGGVSNMGLATWQAPTNMCMRQWMRMVTSAQPKAILMESGYQLATERFWPLLEDLTLHLDVCGYDWWTWRFWSYQVGTPQLRQRMFLVAVRASEQMVQNDLLDTSLNGTKPEACGPWLTPLWDVHPSPKPTNQGITHHWWDPAGCRRQATLSSAPRFKYVTPKQLASIERRVEEDPENSALWQELERAKARLWADCPEGFDTSQVWQHLSWLEAEQPAPTMVGAYKFVHPRGDRLLTQREMALLMGFPIDWEFANYSPCHVIQGVPAMNATWAVNRLRQVMGWEP